MDPAKGGGRRCGCVSRRAAVHAAVAVAVLGALGGIAVLLRAHFGSFFEALERTGPWAGVAVLGLMAGFALFLLPVWFFAIFLGFVYGWAVGLAAVTGCYLAACSLNFAIGRRPGTRAWVERRLESFPSWPYLREEVERAGFPFITMVRFSPFIPFGLSSYAFGVCDVGYAPYAAATVAGLSPKNLLYCLVGDVLQDVEKAEEKYKGDKGLQIATYCGVAVLLVVLAALGWMTRRAVRRRVDRNRLAHAGASRSCDETELAVAPAEAAPAPALGVEV